MQRYGKQDNFCIFDIMNASEKVKVYTVEEYILFEEAGEVRHEFINGNLYEMSGASREHHFICQYFLLALLPQCLPLGFKVYMENMKLAIPGGNQFYYPDIFITKEKQTEQNKYIQYDPELIIEVLSESTRTKDSIDKFIQYRKIDTLKYYLIAEPEKCLAMCYFKQANGDWDMISYTQKEEIIALPNLDISLQLNQIYTT
jgi:Uma2 family endonuclease